MSERIDGLLLARRLVDARGHHLPRPSLGIDAAPAIARRLDGVLPHGSDFASALRTHLELARMGERPA